MALKLVQRIGTGLMVTIALGIQPAQYALAAQGSALLTAQATNPPPPDNCDPPPSDPDIPYDGCHRIGSSTTPGSPPQVKYFLLPGIGDKGPNAYGESSYFEGTHLPEFLAPQGQSTIAAVQPWADWKNKDLTVQGSDLASSINATASPQVILIGHSMGGLRGRSALEFNTATYPSLQTKVKALVTLGTPNFGAPIIEKGKPAATLLGGVLGVALSGFVGLGPYLPGAVGMFGARTWAASIIDTPSGRDMRPNGNSAFLNRLNSGAEKIPSGVALLRVSGLNSSIDSYGASAGIAANTGQVAALRSNLGNVMFVFGVTALAMAFFTFGATIPWGLALIAAAYLLLNLPAFWRSNVMGAASGDGVVPEDSQKLPINIGGKRAGSAQQPVADLDLLTAVHTGRYGEYQAQSNGEYTENTKLQRRLQDLQTSLSIPVS